MVGLEEPAVTATRREAVTPRVTAATVRRALRAAATPARATAALRYFKTGPGEYGEGDRFLGVTVPDQRRVAREAGNLALLEVTKLLRSAWHEERLVALFILVRRFERGSLDERAAIFRLYLANLDRVNNWDLVDSSAPHIVGGHLRMGSRAALRTMARSRSVWERRVAILATLAFIKDGDIRDTLVIARILLHDAHDLIHKAVGWMLREVANRDPDVAQRFLDRHARSMPRTMLRYAVEKLPRARREWYMSAGKRERGSGSVQTT